MAQDYDPAQEARLKDLAQHFWQMFTAIMAQRPEEAPLIYKAALRGVALLLAPNIAAAGGTATEIWQQVHDYGSEFREALWEALSAEEHRD